MRVVRIRKGLNIPLKGIAENIVETVEQAQYFAIKPLDFIGLQPKMLVKEGDRVLAGSPLFFNKLNERIVISSPVSGIVTEILRGEKRVILEVRIKGDSAIEYQSFNAEGQMPTSKERIVELLLKSGLWALIRQRPYDIIPNPDIVPRDIYISTFDSSPLAPDYAFILRKQEALIQAAVDALAKLTTGRVNFGIRAKSKDVELFESIKNVEMHYFTGPHPVGNVGVQVHHTRPINKGEVIWYINIQDLVTIGKLLLNGIYDSIRTIAVVGAEAEKPCYVNVYTGTNVTELIKAKSPIEKVRIISGNVLTGTQIMTDGFLGFYHHQLSLISEGNYYELLGWASLGIGKFSNSRLFLNKLIPKISFNFDTNYHGGERAFVMSGEYEKVFPFDIFPVYLIKAILADDFDKMEQLGIYEVSAEDFALCEFVCTSKIEIQEIVRNGLEKLRKEMS